jgi:hypothetical protein
MCCKLCLHYTFGRQGSKESAAQVVRNGRYVRSDVDTGLARFAAAAHLLSLAYRSKLIYPHLGSILLPLCSLKPSAHRFMALMHTWY